MAAEAPVSDVLCEAMEYLAKLGSNLRTRSENLKEKRISKEKLKNVHAVHKAASKVLLICELSKKSLENVETGVRRVLSILDASQSGDIGAKTSGQKKRDNIKYYNFEYKSQKLRMTKKISLKHYFSAKVIARNMPISMQEKYPVYYDCKLKSQRQKAIRQEKAQNSGENEVGTSGPSEKEETYLHRDSTTEQEITASTQNQESCELLMSEENDLHKNQDESIETIENPQMKSQHCRNKVGSNPVSDEEMSRPSSRTENVNQDPLKDKSNFESESECNSKIKNNEKHSRKKCGSNCDNHNNDSESEMLKKTCEESRQRCMSTNESHSDMNNIIDNGERQLKKTEMLISDNDSGSKNSSDQGMENKDDENDDDDTTKPVIRCVNIAKLLKPDVVNKKNNHPSSSEPNKQSKFSKQCTDVSRIKQKSNRMKKVLDEDFWVLKRKEVELFKPKQFSINIERLPELSVDFLTSHNIKKITQDNNIICEVNKNKSNKNLESNIVAVKNALLTDSEPEDCSSVKQTKIPVTEEAEKVKMSLLNDSDSDTNKEPNTKAKQNGIQPTSKKAMDPEVIKDSLLKDSDSDKEPDKEKLNEFDSDSADSHKELSAEVNDKIKSALLDDSDSENKNTEDEHKTKLNDEKCNNPPDNSEIEADTILQNNQENDVNDKDVQQETNESPNKDPEKIKSSLLNDSSDSKSDKSDTDTTSLKDKLLGHRQRQAKRNRHAKKKYSSSSDNEKEGSQNSSDENVKRHKLHKRSRKKSRICSSSSSEDISNIKNKKKRPKDSDSESNNRSISQVDGTIDEQSNSSARKVRKYV